MSLPLAEKAWLILPEAPEDDGAPTGKYFATLNNVIDFDFDGSPIPGENILESHQFDSFDDAEKFVELSQHPTI